MTAFLVVANADTIGFSPEQISPSVQLIQNDKSGDLQYDKMIAYLNNLDDRFDQEVMKLAKEGDRRAQYLLIYWADNCRTMSLSDTSEEIKPSFQRWMESNIDNSIAKFVQYPQESYDSKPTKRQTELLIKAALDGQPDAQYAVYGLLVSKNEDKAIKYLVDSARNGQPDAIKLIANMVDPSQIISRYFKKDAALAAYLYWYAAQFAGQNDAKVSLSEMVAKGIGTKKDVVIAYALNLAAHNDANFCYSIGYSSQSDYWDDLLQKRKKIAKSMSKKEIDQAVSLSKNLKKLFGEASKCLFYKSSMNVTNSSSIPTEFVAQINTTANVKLTDAEYLNYKRIYPQYATADKELNHAFSSLRNTLSEQEKQKLKEEQNAWINVRDKILYNTAKKATQNYIDKLVELTQNRTIELNNRIQ